MLNLSNHSFDYEPYPLGHFKEIFTNDLYKSLCEEYPDVSELKISEAKFSELNPSGSIWWQFGNICIYINPKIFRIEIF